MECWEPRRFEGQRGHLAQAAEEASELRVEGE
jgi:hypothetical protein